MNAAPSPGAPRTESGAVLGAIRQALRADRLPRPRRLGVPLLTAALVATGTWAGDSSFDRLLAGACFGAYAGTIGDLPITLVLTRSSPDAVPDPSYSYDHQARYDAASNLMRPHSLALEEEGFADGQVRWRELDPATGEVSGHFTGVLGADPVLAGEWRKPGAEVGLPFRLQPLTTLRQGRHPAFAVRIPEGVLEIAGEKPIQLSGEGGFVEPLFTDCGLNPFELSVKRLRGDPDIYVLDMAEHGDSGPFRDARYLAYRRPGDPAWPTWFASEVSRCSTTAGLGWDCDDNRVRYAYQGSVLTIIDEKDSVREVAPELWDPAGCLAVDRRLSIQRWDLKGDAARCDKVVHIRGEPSEGQCEAEAGAEASTATGATASPRPTGLAAWLFDDGLSGWLLIPREPASNLGRVTQYPGDPKLEIRPGPGTGLWDGPAPRAEQYNGPNTGWRLACWLYNRTPGPAAFQDRAYPPALAPGSARLPADAPEPGLCSLAPVEDWWSADSQNWEIYGFGPLNLRRSLDGKALEAHLSGETEPLALIDGEHCYHRDLKEPGRWGLPWDGEL